MEEETSYHSALQNICPASNFQKKLYDEDG